MSTSRDFMSGSNATFYDEDGSNVIHQGPARLTSWPEGAPPMEECPQAGQSVWVNGREFVVLTGIPMQYRFDSNWRLDLATPDRPNEYTQAGVLGVNIETEPPTKAHRVTITATIDAKDTSDAAIRAMEDVQGGALRGAMVECWSDG